MSPWPKKDRKEEKVQLSVSIDKDLIDWVRREVDNKTFAHVSHAFELALHRLRDEYAVKAEKKKDRKP